ncbi:hypothetical protein CFI11_08255 [Thalassococcus sp. S3]|nr:hypothetical protein CFI11_08255 [Thalassococcus sp. S3]
MVIFAVYLFICMFLVTGLGIDLMRYERDRTRLQYTLDRAVLAAADMDQPLSPDAVVEDYFAKAGLSEFLSSVTVEDGLNFRTVSGTASTEVQTQFIHMVGLDTLEAPAASVAEERIEDVEISLVLDVSGSMNRSSRLTNLKVAAKDFVDEMLDNSDPGQISISIIPYATQVSVPQEIFDQLNVSTEHNYSRCINWAGNDFKNTTISTTASYKRTMHFDPWERFEGRKSTPKNLVRDPVCEHDASREILVLEDNRATLKSFIDNLFADGNTSLDLGMKWGAILLDPSFQTIASTLAADGDIDAGFSDRPAAHTDNETIKVIVLMTDGQNTSQYYLRNAYRSGNTNIWWNDNEKKYSIYNPDTGRFYWPHLNRWEDHAFGAGFHEVCEDRWHSWYGWIRSCEDRSEAGNAVRLTYPELWAFTTMKDIVEDLHQPWMGSSQAWNDWYYNVRRSYSSSNKNTRTKNICKAAKNNQTIVFTIGFEAPSASETLLQDCASSVSHYFDVDGLEISDAFVAIASSIRQLRLTQ